MLGIKATNNCEAMISLEYLKSFSFKRAKWFMEAIKVLIKTWQIVVKDFHCFWKVNTKREKKKSFSRAEI